MEIFNNTLLNLFAILTALTAILVVWLKWSHTYWTNKGLINPPTNLFLGNLKDVFTQKDTFATFTKSLYDYYRRHGKLHGGFYFFWMPTYMPCDPEIVKNIMQNDFQHFVDRGVYLNEEKDPLSAHLFSLEGAKWRNLRIKITPTFTSGKMRMMFDTLVKCSEQLTVEMNKDVGAKPVNIKDILVRFTTDIIGTCAFGIDCNSLKDPDNEFCKYGKLFFESNLWDNIISLLTFVLPNVMNACGTIAIKRELSKFFFRIVRETVDYREKNNIYRKDFMHLLLQLKNKGKLVDDETVNEGLDKNDNTFSFNELAAQAFVFFLAGFETSSTTMTFCLFELASNHDIQEKLRTEITTVLSKHDNELTYDAIMEMTYMDKVINETLRKYPPLPALNRVCTKDYKVPGTDVLIEKGTKVFIPVLGLQTDEEYYPDPERFDPERFSEEQKNSRHPYTFIPFGEGPRICIGLRFGIMQTKMGLTILLKNYRFSVNSNTVTPLKLNPKSFIMASESGIWLDYTKVNG